MKLLFSKQVFIILTLFFLDLSAQPKQLFTIYGRVISTETGDPLPYVNVFLDATTLGTSTNNNGEYEIGSIPTGSYRIIASMVGFKQKDKNIKLTELVKIEIDFELDTIAYKLDEINVTSERDLGWIDNAKLFQKHFLGSSNNSEECKITNKEILEFSKSATNRLIAKALTPLEIVNEAMGYKIIFDLKEFVLSNNDEVNYQGNIRFVELPPPNLDQEKEWMERREVAYYGSFRHFLVSLCQNKLNENDFFAYKVNHPNWEDLRRRNFLNPNLFEAVERVTKNERILQFNNFVMVAYMEEWEEANFLTYRNYMGSSIYRVLEYQTSWINLPYGFATFDINGNIVDDYKSIKVYGYWGWQKVASLLPTNYVPANSE